MPEEEKKEKKDEDKVVLLVHMHCEACKKKVRRSVMSYPGVEDIDIDMKGQKLTVKGKIDAKKFFEVVKKKSGGRAKKILYPEPKKPVDVTVMLKMHCEACAKKVLKIARKTEDVDSAEIEGDKVTIKGKDLEPKKFCELMAKESGRHAEIVPPPKKDQKDGKKEDEGAKKEESKAVEKAAEYAFPPPVFSEDNPNAYCRVM